MNVKNAVKKIFVWFRIENVRESRLLYEICSKLFCSAYMAAGSPDAVNDPINVHSFDNPFKLPSLAMRTSAHTTWK